jgi:hypothetical protein
MKAINEVGGLVLSGPGTLEFSVMHGNETLANWQMNVVNIGQTVVQTELPLTTETPNALGPSE